MIAIPPRTDAEQLREAMAIRTDVVALYVDPLGPYPKLLADGHWFDEARDARTYAGPWPVVAHPPCRLWSKLKHLSKDASRYRWKDGTADAAVKSVRSWGGVLEQPAGSAMWDVFGFPRPGEPYTDPWGGISWEVQQCDWGHVARKRTWLYCVRTRTPQKNVPKREPTHWCSGGRTRRPGMGATVPDGIKVCSAQQRRRTPIAFAEWLIELASSVCVGAAERIAKELP